MCILGGVSVDDMIESKVLNKVAIAEVQGKYYGGLEQGHDRE